MGKGGDSMKNNYDIYYIVVHVVNLLLLGGIGFLAFALAINISPPGPIPNFDALKFGLLVFLTVMWAINYWYQYKKRNWILPIAGTVLYIAIALFIMGVVMPFLYEIVY
jgi:hypothetical protein